MAKEAAPKKSTKTTRASAPRTRATAKKTTRKAPTRAAKKEQASFNIKIALAVLIAAATVSGIGVYIGMSDTGAIDVSQTIDQEADTLEAQGDAAGSDAVRSVSRPNSRQGNDSRVQLIGSGNAETEQQRLEQQRRSQEESARATSSEANSEDDVETATSSSEANETGADTDADTASTVETEADPEQEPETEETQSESGTSEADASMDGPGR